MANSWTFRQIPNLREDESLQRLMQFYLIQSPVPGASVKGETFKKQGWKKHSFLSLQAQMRSSSKNFTKANWITSSTKDIPKELQNLGRFDNFDCSFEFAVHTVKSGLNQTEALFYFIRNSFAHGGYRKCKYENDIYYVFENRQGKRLKGRAVLAESTLLAWINLVKKGPSAVPSNRKRRNDTVR